MLRDNFSCLTLLEFVHQNGFVCAFGVKLKFSKIQNRIQKWGHKNPCNRVDQNYKAQLTDGQALVSGLCTIIILLNNIVHINKEEE